MEFSLQVLNKTMRVGANKRCSQLHTTRHARLGRRSRLVVPATAGQLKGPFDAEERRGGRLNDWPRAESICHAFRRAVLPLRPRDPWRDAYALGQSGRGERLFRERPSHDAWRLLCGDVRHARDVRQPSYDVGLRSWDVRQRLVLTFVVLLVLL